MPRKRYDKQLVPSRLPEESRETVQRVAKTHGILQWAVLEVAVMQLDKKSAAMDLKAAAASYPAGGDEAAESPKPKAAAKKRPAASTPPAKIPATKKKVAKKKATTRKKTSNRK